VKYGDLYRQDNVVLSGTHTHCGPAGYFQYTLFMITSSGYIKTSTEPLVNGIVKVCMCVCSHGLTCLIGVMIMCGVCVSLSQQTVAAGGIIKKNYNSVF